MGPISYEAKRESEIPKRTALQTSMQVQLSIFVDTGHWKGSPGMLWNETMCSAHYEVKDSGMLDVRSHLAKVAIPIFRLLIIQTLGDIDACRGA